MILASGVLLLTAIGLLIAGWLADLELAYIYGSIGATVLAGVFLLLGVRSRRGRRDAAGGGVGEVPSHVTPVDALLGADDGAPRSALDGAGTETVPTQSSVRVESRSGLDAEADNAATTDSDSVGATAGTATMPAIPAPAPPYDDVSFDQTAHAPAGAAGSGSGSGAAGTAGIAVIDPDVPGPPEVTVTDRTSPADDAIGPDVLSPDLVGPAVVGPAVVDPEAVDPAVAGPDVHGSDVHGADLVGPASTGTALTDRTLTDLTFTGAEAVAEPVAPASPARKVTSRKVASTTPRSPQLLSPAESVLVIPDRDRYHRAACRFVRTPNLAATMPRSDAAGRGYQPCGVCKP